MKKSATITPTSITAAIAAGFGSGATTVGSPAAAAPATAPRESAPPTPPPPLPTVAVPPPATVACPGCHQPRPVSSSYATRLQGTVRVRYYWCPRCGCKFRGQGLAQQRA